jgi:hypothetical protein
MTATSASRIGVPLRRAQAALAASTARYGAEARAIFVREPLVDEHCPESGDIDLIVFGEAEDLIPERVFFDDHDGGCSADLIRMPASRLDDPEGFAVRGMLPHRLLSSRLVHDRDGWGRGRAEEVARHMFAPQVQGERVASVLGLGYLTVRQIGVDWDFPPVALFWLHMAWCACLAALADAARVLCPNVYTRPFDYTSRLEDLTGIPVASPLASRLRLDGDPAAVVPALRRLQRSVAARFPEPPWPAATQASARAEYRYFGSARETEFRVRAAAEMSRRGRAANGLFYLRLLAYALSRIPTVHDDSVRGETTGFLRPARSVRPDLVRLCPEILDDLAFILGGAAPLDAGHVERALDDLTALRQRVVAFIEAADIALPALREWTPFVRNKEMPRGQDRRDL